MNIDQAKLSGVNIVKYYLANATVYSGEHGYTFSLFMDAPVENSAKIDEQQYSQTKIYIENQLQSNLTRFENQVELATNYIQSGSKVLDVGCGGGIFLSLLSAKEYETLGIELEPNRKRYCEEVHSLTVLGMDPTDKEFSSKNLESFDAVTYWDVIEHVNYPSNHIKNAFDLLKSGGYLFLDTPAKDTFYHQVGHAIYKLTGGRKNIFLDVMYSEHPFGHKQIFSTKELEHELTHAGFSVISLKKVHELSFPYDFYLTKMLKNKLLVKVSSVLVNALFKIFPVKNKMVIVAQKLEK